jgi:hypothetical protein
MKKLLMGHKIYHIIDSVYLWPLSVTLTLEVGVQVLCMTLYYHCVVHDKASHYSDFLCQVFSKSFDLWKSYGPDTKYITDYVNLWPPSVTLNLEAGDRFWAWHIVSLLLTIAASIYKIPSKIRKLWTGHVINPQIDSVDLEWASATLTLEVEVWLLSMTHRLIITNICAKLFQIPLINDKVMDRTRKWRTDEQPEPIFIPLLLYFIIDGIRFFFYIF